MSAAGRVLAPSRSGMLWERFVSGSGLTIALVLAVLLAVTWPIFEARWVALPIPVPLVAVGGLALAAYVVLSNAHAYQGHMFAVIIGGALALVAGMAVVDGGDSGERLRALFASLAAWVAAVPTDEVRQGIPEFAVFITALAWVLGYLGGWWVLRARTAWPLVLLGALVLLLVLSNVGTGATLRLALFMAASALLLIHVSTIRRLSIWRDKRLSFDPFTVLSQSAFMLALGLVAVLVVSGLPSPRLAPLAGLTSGLERTVDQVASDFSRLFNALPSRVSFKTLNYNDRTFFTGNPNLTDELLFTVTGERGTYWRARSYDEYSSTGWQATNAEFEPLPDAVERDDARRVENEHYFRVSAASNTYFSGGLPVSVSEPADGLVHPEAPEDILQVRLSDQREFFPTRVNLRYSSVGSESNATAFNLRDAGDAYPAWVSEHYLQLPTSLPDRVRELAAGITEAHDNPYDKAEAVRRYLARMPYNLNIPAPTDGRDAVDFLLFDLRQGYCDYFASAMAVMLRSLDIPARYVLGYTSGAYDNDLDEYRVLDLNYHSWVEVYFPGYGWIPFEPTPADAIEFSGPGNTPITPPEGTGQEDIGPLMEEEELDEGLAFDLPDLDIQQGLSLTIPFIIGGTVAGLLLFGGIFWYRFWLILGRLHRPDELYAKMLRLAGLVGVPRAVGQTPREYGEMLAGEVPGREEDIRTIASAYARRRYGDGAMPLSDVRHAEAAWARVRGVLVRRLLRIEQA